MAPHEAAGGSEDGPACLGVHRRLCPQDRGGQVSPPWERPNLRVRGTSTWACTSYASACGQLPPGQGPRPACVRTCEHAAPDSTSVALTPPSDCQVRKRQQPTQPQASAVKEPKFNPFCQIGKKYIFRALPSFRNQPACHRVKGLAAAALKRKPSWRQLTASHTHTHAGHTHAGHTHAGPGSSKAVTRCRATSVHWKSN